GRRRIPSPRRVDKDGELRVIALPHSFDAFVERGFGRMRQYVAKDMNAATHAFAALAAVGAQCKSTEAREALGAEAKNLLSLAEQELQGPSLEKVREQYQTTAASLA
ncbi:MAG: DUF2254 domain-containing protein, partial [Sphingomonas sp.]|nr:DUF2254 domain-containing protein [Sphingomonas sp.]